MRNYKIFTAFILSLALASTALASNLHKKKEESSGRLTVVARSMFIEPLKDILLEYYEKHPEILLSLKTGEDNILEDLIIQQQGYDIFIGASTSKAFEYLQRKYVKTNYLFAVEQLALYAPYEKVQDIEILLLQTGKISILNPEMHDIGKAAIQALQAYNLYEKLKDRIIYVNSLEEQLKNLDKRVAEAGFFPYSYLYNKKLAKTRETWILPKGTYEFIPYSVMINSKADIASEDLVQDLIKLASKRAVAKYGFADITTMEQKKRPDKINVQDYYPQKKADKSNLISVPLHK